MNKLFCLCGFIAIIFATPHVQAQQNDGTKSLGIIIETLSGDIQNPAINDSEESDFIDPNFLLDDRNLYDDYNKVSIRILDKITAESKTFDLHIGKTVAYGGLRIRPMACKKTPPIEEPESASFIQIWEKMHTGQDEWVFSGWMFASSPSLSAMEHPVYDVWVTDCNGEVIISSSDAVNEPSLE